VDGALADYNRALELNPALSLVYFTRAQVWCERGHWARARADYDQAIALNPRFADAHCKRGLVRLRQGEETEAEKDFARCLELNPELRADLARRIKDLKQQLAARGLR
jgi:tetratricopeptide (TPR) repeat protein